MEFRYRHHGVARNLPRVIHINGDFFRSSTCPLNTSSAVKRFHDHFINRIWAISSANLGLGLWRVYDKPKDSRQRHDEIEAQLAEVGMDGTEHYPMPSRSAGSKGKCHRRPCGMDSGIITENGIIIDPIKQIELFMQPPPTPSFETVCTAIIGRLEAMYAEWLRWDHRDTIN